MADKTADFELGTVGNTISTGDAGSATAWNGVTGSPVYDNTHAAHGSKAMKIPNATNQQVYWNGLATATLFGRFYLYVTAYTSTNSILFRDGNQWRVQFTTAGKLLAYSNGLAKSVGTSTPITQNQWTRIEWKLVPSAFSGQIEIKTFNGDSTTPIETATGTADWDVGANPGVIQIGITDFFGSDNYGSDLWIDDVVANATSYPGPAVAAASTSGLLAIL